MNFRLEVHSRELVNISNSRGLNPTSRIFRQRFVVTIGHDFEIQNFGLVNSNSSQDINITFILGRHERRRNLHQLYVYSI